MNYVYYAPLLCRFYVVYVSVLSPFYPPFIPPCCPFFVILPPLMRLNCSFLRVKTLKKSYIYYKSAFKMRFIVLNSPLLILFKRFSWGAFVFLNFYI